VEIRIHIPAPPHCDGAARPCTETLLPCRRHQLTESALYQGTTSVVPKKGLRSTALAAENGFFAAISSE
jgi:hypothetical protein